MANKTKKTKAVKKGAKKPFATQADIVAIRALAKEKVEGLYATMVDVKSIGGYDVGRQEEEGKFEVAQPLVRVYEDESKEPRLADDGEEWGDRGDDEHGAYIVDRPGYETDHYEQPMYNAAWPLPDVRGTTEHIAQTLARSRVPLCLIHGDDVPSGKALALTGAGMDMSWDIAEAYIALGYLPPASLRVPAFAGEKYDLAHAIIIEAIRHSQEIRHRQIQYDEKDLAMVEESLIARALGKRD